MQRKTASFPSLASVKWIGLAIRLRCRTALGLLGSKFGSWVNTVGRRQKKPAGGPAGKLNRTLNASGFLDQAGFNRFNRNQHTLRAAIWQLDANTL